MKPINPKVYKKYYPSGKPFWRVTCTLPTGNQYHKKHSTESNAETDRRRLIREVTEEDVGVIDFKMVEAALLKLKNTSNPDARDKNILTAVDWFVENYSEKSFELPVSEYIEDFLERKRKRRTPKTMREVEYYLRAFDKIYGIKKPSDIPSEELEKHLQVNKHRYHRHKILRHFFAWLSNSAKDISKLKQPPLSTNPFDHIEKPKQKNSKPQICSVEEVKALIGEAIRKDCVTWFVWGFFTGMRPEAEMKPFWKNPEFGWKFVDLEDRKIIVSDEIEKTGRRTREIKIHENLMEWINLFKSQPKKYSMIPVDIKRKFRSVKFAVLPETKAREQDIMRHTFISNLSRIESIGEVCYQCATSMSMIRKHYKVLITDKKRVEEFFKIRPLDFDL